MSKSLTELSLNISEQIYRDLPQLSYSTMARYEKGGFGAIAKLFEPVSSDSITFGSAVDAIVTEGMDAFNAKFAVADFQLPSEALTTIAEALLDESEEDSMNNVPDEDILAMCNRFAYCAKMSDEVRIRKVREGCTDYYNSMKKCQGKTIISDKVYNDVLETVAALKSTPITASYLKDKAEGTNIEFLYQQKFTTTLDGLDVKMMADLIIVNHDKKAIIPVDLKTSGMPEYCFPNKYLENRYDIQAKLYWHILRNVLDSDAYFKDFRLLDFHFIVVNKITKTPLVFVDEKCKEDGDTVITFKSGRTFTLRNPITIGKELKNYLDTAATLPEGFTQEKPVSIYEILNKE